MSHSQAFESQLKTSDKSHEAGHQAVSHIAAQAWHPSEAGQAKQIKTEPNAIDFNKTGDIYARKETIPVTTGDPKLQGGAHTATDNSQANTTSAAKPVESGLTKIQPEVVPNIYDFSNKKSQGETKPAVGTRPDTTNDAAADGKKQNDKPASADKPASSSSSISKYWQNLQKLWSSEVANSIGYGG